MLGPRFQVARSCLGRTGKGLRVAKDCVPELVASEEGSDSSRGIGTNTSGSLHRPTHTTP